MSYDFKKIEEKWRQIWEQDEIYKVTEDPEKQKYYVLDMFPYPSGAGLHVGHPLGYIASDIFARYKRLNKFNVLHPMGYDSFGLPAEQYAIQTGQHPEITTEKNINRYRKQLNKMGFSFDWSREIRTSNISYYKWTQWIFKKLFNSYYCNVDDKALPISNLIGEFERNGNTNVKSPCDEDTPSFTKNDWKIWTDEKKQTILLKYRLAFLSDTWVNWCEKLGTVLANDEVKEGHSERGGFPVKKRKMKQWSLRITAYAERLINDLNTIDWPDSIKEIQKNWIGKSKGVSIHFKVEKSSHSIEVFTTRPDTIFGVSFIVLAPEHDLIKHITSKEKKMDVETYFREIQMKSDKDRQSNIKEVTGVFSGGYAVHPLNNTMIPIWISDYVLSSYGTGAIMAVPAGDERDWAFAKKFDIEIPNIFKNTSVDENAYTEKNTTITNSSFLNELSIKEAGMKVIQEITKRKIGSVKIQYKLRDAVFSRQRYWGEPFPIFYQNNIPYLIEDNIGVQLPIVDKYLPTPDGDPPLARAKKENWNIFKGDRMEYNTMPGWAGSSWYFLRYMDPNNENEFVSEEKMSYWQQVDLYVGGAEHAVGHLLYSRFWTKFLFDCNLIHFNEPFKKLINQGMILGRSNFVYRIQNTNKFVSFEQKNKYETTKLHVNIEYVDNDILNIEEFKKWRKEFENAEFILNHNNKYLCGAEVEKMSKSKYNTQNPDDLIEKYGADTLRMYEMFLGPIEQSKPWDTKGINGVHNFLRKLWRLIHDENNTFQISNTPATDEEYKCLHTCIQKITFDLNRFSFNTAISNFMICLNELSNLNCNKKEILNSFIILLHPFAPYISEEIWQLLGNKNSINLSSWPKLEEKYLIEKTFNYPVAFNGKTRFLLKISNELDKKEIEKITLSNPKTKKYLTEKEVKKIIIIPKKMINIVF